MLGVGKHADGGFIGSSGSFNKNIWENNEDKKDFNAMLHDNKDADYAERKNI